MRKTRLVILPGVRSLNTIGCLLLFLACPTIAFKGQENREVEPICNAQNVKELWLEESPWPGDNPYRESNDHGRRPRLQPLTHRTCLKEQRLDLKNDVEHGDTRTKFGQSRRAAILEGNQRRISNVREAVRRSDVRRQDEMRRDSRREFTFDVQRRDNRRSDESVRASQPERRVESLKRTERSFDYNRRSRVQSQENDRNTRTGRDSRRVLDSTRESRSESRGDESRRTDRSVDVIQRTLDTRRVDARRANDENDARTGLRVRRDSPRILENRSERRADNLRRNARSVDDIRSSLDARRVDARRAESNPTERRADSLRTDSARVSSPDRRSDTLRRNTRSVDDIRSSVDTRRDARREKEARTGFETRRDSRRMLDLTGESRSDRQADTLRRNARSVDDIRSSLDTRRVDARRAESNPTERRTDTLRTDSARVSSPDRRSDTLRRNTRSVEDIRSTVDTRRDAQRVESEREARTGFEARRDSRRMLDLARENRSEKRADIMRIDSTMASFPDRRSDTLRRNTRSADDIRSSLDTRRDTWRVESEREARTGFEARRDSRRILDLTRENRSDRRADTLRADSARASFLDRRSDTLRRNTRSVDDIRNSLETRRDARRVESEREARTGFEARRDSRRIHDLTRETRSDRRTDTLRRNARSVDVIRSTLDTRRADARRVESAPTERRADTLRRNTRSVDDIRSSLDTRRDARGVDSEREARTGFEARRDSRRILDFPRESRSDGRADTLRTDSARTSFPEKRSDTFRGNARSEDDINRSLNTRRVDAQRVDSEREVRSGDFRQDGRQVFDSARDTRTDRRAYTIRTDSARALLSEGRTDTLRRNTRSADDIRSSLDGRRVENEREVRSTDIRRNSHQVLDSTRKIQSDRLTDTGMRSDSARAAPIKRRSDTLRRIAGSADTRRDVQRVGSEREMQSGLEARRGSQLVLDSVRESGSYRRADTLRMNARPADYIHSSLDSRRVDVRRVDSEREAQTGFEARRDSQRVLDSTRELRSDRRAETFRRNTRSVDDILSSLETRREAQRVDSKREVQTGFEARRDSHRVFDLTKELQFDRRADTLRRNARSIDDIRSSLDTQRDARRVDSEREVRIGFEARRDSRRLFDLTRENRSDTRADSLRRNARSVDDIRSSLDTRRDARRVDSKREVQTGFEARRDGRRVLDLTRKSRSDTSRMDSAVGRRATLRRSVDEIQRSDIHLQDARRVENRNVRSSFVLGQDSQRLLDSTRASALERRDDMRRNARFVEEVQRSDIRRMDNVGELQSGVGMRQNARREMDSNNESRFARRIDLSKASSPGRNADSMRRNARTIGDLQGSDSRRQVADEQIARSSVNMRRSGQRVMESNRVSLSVRRAETSKVVETTSVSTSVRWVDSLRRSDMSGDVRRSDARRQETRAVVERAVRSSGEIRSDGRLSSRIVDPTRVSLYKRQTATLSRRANSDDNLRRSGFQARRLDFERHSEAQADVQRFNPRKNEFHLSDPAAESRRSERQRRQIPVESRSREEQSIKAQNFIRNIQLAAFKAGLNSANRKAEIRDNTRSMMTSAAAQTETFTFAGLTKEYAGQQSLIKGLSSLLWTAADRIIETDGIAQTLMYGGVMCFAYFANSNKKPIF